MAHTVEARTQIHDQQLQQSALSKTRSPGSKRSACKAAQAKTHATTTPTTGVADDEGSAAEAQARVEHADAQTGPAAKAQERQHKDLRVNQENVGASRKAESPPKIHGKHAGICRQQAASANAPVDEAAHEHRLRVDVDARRVGRLEAPDLVKGADRARPGDGLHKARRTKAKTNDDDRHEHHPRQC